MKQDTFKDEPITFWNGESTLARRCSVIVGKAEKSTYWYAELEGQTIQAVEIQENESGHKFYIDNTNDKGWRKVTIGKGSPSYSHSSLEINSVVCYHQWKRRLHYLEENDNIRGFRICQKCGFERELKGIVCRGIEDE